MKNKVLLFPFLIAVSILCLTRCVKEDSECLMTGTVSEHTDYDLFYTGGIYIIYIDIDSDPDNINHVKTFAGVFPVAELKYSFDISDVPSGTYYIYMMMDLGQGFFNVGYYGADPMPWDIPATPNAQVECGAVFDWEIYD
ncbi:MAG: hypothetical protein JXB49_21530 [Bacteroidales bacterium]|nr:hypothetical protein [Bacteroidales bacterium]